MKNNNDYRKDFPVFTNKNKIAYLDSGATSQKPKQVIDAVKNFYENSNANPYRGSYALSVEATNIYNQSRETVQKFVNAKFPEEIIFTKNATESLNLVAYSYGFSNLKENDEIVLSISEHHSNLVPLQQIAKLTKAKLNFMYLNDNYELDRTEIDKKITPKTKIVAISTVSNALGTVFDVDYIIKKAHGVGAIVILDATQSVAHKKIDVQKLDADFVAFSAHKMFAPLGIGVLYGKKGLLEKMPPFLCGGDMIEYVYEDHATFASLPHKFEAGTQNVAGALGLAEAIRYIEKIGFTNIEKKEKELITYAYNELKKLNFVTLYTTSNLKNLSAVISFNVNGIHSHDIASILDYQGVCVRSGDHCAQPLMRFLHIDSTCRASFSIYNTKNDVDMLINALKFAYEKFKKYINKEV